MNGTVLLCGIATETPLEMVRAELEHIGATVVTFHQRRFATADICFDIDGGTVTGWLHTDGARYRLEDFTGVYARLMDDRCLPELAHEPSASDTRARCRALHETLGLWCEIAPCRVLNRNGPMASNFSKPYQAQLIRQMGFAVPETLVTNDPDLAREFCHVHGRVIYKSISGVRSIVQIVEDRDLNRLDDIRWCPTQFQAFVEGTNIRVHTVGAEVLATAVETTAIDYRYAERQGGQTSLTAYDLSGDLANRCVQLSQALGLGFAGIDLKITPTGEVYCFEVNPSPAFSYYESHTGQPIARTVARFLAGAAP